MQAFQDAVDPRRGLVYATDLNPLSAALYVADGRFLSPRSDSVEYLDVMLEHCRSLGIGLLVPTRDEELPVFASARERFEDAGVTVAVASPKTVALCQDKRAFIEFCELEGFGHPRTYDPAAAGSGAVDFPVYVKPRIGKGGAGGSIARDANALAAALTTAGEGAVVQALDGAPEYTVDVFADFSSRVISAVPRQRIVIVAGESYVSRTLKAPALIDAAAALAERLGLVAHNTIQCFFDGDGVRFIEVNPRYGGAANLGFAAGAPTPQWLVALAASERVEPRLYEFEDGKVMLRYTQDVFLSAADLEGRA